MRRRTPTIVGAVWSILCVAVTTLWALSHTPPATAGRLRFSFSTPGDRQLREVQLKHGVLRYQSFRRLSPPLSFAYGPAHSTSVSLPATGVVLLGAALPLVIGKQRQLRERRRLGLCTACGYDMRATPDRCPECGAVAAPT